MADLPFLWALYQENQLKAAQCGRITDRSWGVENGLTKLLIDIEAAAGPASYQDTQVRFDRAVATGSRNERHRARLRRQYLPPDPAPLVERSIIARIFLREIQNAVSNGEWKILVGVANGLSYSELVNDSSSGALRTRLSRLRTRVRGLATSAVDTAGKRTTR